LEEIGPPFFHIEGVDATRQAAPDLERQAS